MAQLVSVIVPTFNAQNYIEATLRSVIAQTYANIEIIVVDDASNDQTPAIVERLSRETEAAKTPVTQNIRLERLTPNRGGPAWGRNRGLQLARGFYVAFLDADDLWHPRKLEYQIQIMQEHKVPFSSTKKVEFTQDETILKLLEADVSQSHSNLKKINHESLIRKNIIPNSSVVAEKSLFSQNQFAEDRNFIAVEDYDCWLRIHQIIPFSIQIEVPLLFYRVLPSSISRSKLAMVKKVNHMLSRYRFHGKILGMRRYFYLMTYAWKSICERVWRGYTF